MSPTKLYVGAGQQLYAAKMEAAGRRDEDAQDEDEKTSLAVSIRQVHGLHVVGDGSIRSNRGTEIAGQKPIQVRVSPECYWSVPNDEIGVK